MKSEAYKNAQTAIAELKAAVYETLFMAGKDGLTNAALGRTLGIYAGHIGLEGHISRTLLGMMEAEGVVRQDAESKRWFIVLHS